MPHKDTSLDIQQAIYRSQIKETIQPDYKTGFQVYFLVVNSTELLYELSFI